MDLDSVLNLFDRPFHFITLEAFFGADFGGLDDQEKLDLFVCCTQDTPSPSFHSSRGFGNGRLVSIVIRYDIHHSP